LSNPACATDTLPASAVKPNSSSGAKPVAHIALILPLKSPVFGTAAAAVKQGFMAAANNQKQMLPVRIYECTDESTEIITAYQQAVNAGARAVTGPLTRNGVSVLAGYTQITVPTLALNFAEGKDNDNLYYFGLTAELEARQIAQIAFASGLQHAQVISDGSPLSKRLAQAFSEEWKMQGGHAVKGITYHNDPVQIENLPVIEGNMVFLAADAETAHLIRPYLNMALPVYATSQIFEGNNDTLTNFDLNEVHFIDMPWLLQPDHSAVMIYAHAVAPLSPALERLYALGIDSFRLLQIMLEESYATNLPLDGVTGRIRLNAHQQFQREAIPAIFWQGRGLTPEDVAARKAEMAAARLAAASAVPASAPLPEPEQ
jgi:outer membrane PBP1 activator LpoA protein